MKQIVVLAYSGGLDTSFCAMYLAKELKYDVHTVLANTGGFTNNYLKKVEDRAYKAGAKKHINLDITKEYYNKGIKYMIFGNVLRNETYPISVSSERIFQAIAIINYVKAIKANYVAHGSTGAGNDQIRFDLIFDILAPEINIITPIRDMALTREYEINYLKQHKFETDFAEMDYSFNKGLWGTSIGGKETLKSDQTLPEHIYPSQLQKHEEEILKITFECGEIQFVNEENYQNKVKAIQKIEQITSRYAIGRGIHIGDTIIGIKGRIGFEAAAPLIIINAHRMLEKHTLTKWQQYWKDQLGNWYGLFLHEAQYLDPVMRDIESFLENSQKNVTGTVILRLRPYQYILVGIESEFDLMKTDIVKYGEFSKTWTSEDIKGFIKIMAIPMKIYNKIRKNVNKTNK